MNGKDRDASIKTRMAQMLTRVRLIPVRDVLALSGIAAFVYGIWLAWEPAAYMVGGLILVVVSVLWGIINTVANHRTRRRD